MGHPGTRLGWGNEAGVGLQDGVEPEIEETCGSFLEGGSVLAGGRAQVGRGDACMVQFAGVAYIPALQTVGGDLGMELQCQGEVSEGEGLIGVDFCFCEMERAGGKVEVL